MARNHKKGTGRRSTTGSSQTARPTVARARAQHIEQELAAAAARGDNTAREQLLVLHQATLEATARRHKHVLDPDDGLQEAYLAVIECIADYDPTRATVATYISAVVGWHLSDIAAKERLWRNRWKGADV